MNTTTANQFDPALAVEYGKLVDVAYSMYPTDPLTPKFPGYAGYKFIAWVQMQDFWGSQESPLCFYGFVVQRESQTNNFVLVIRGTMNFVEFYDDLKAVRLTPLEKFGSVGDGFERIFQTMRVIEADGTPTDQFGTGMDFTKQVAVAIEKHAALETLRSIEVTGHSLGSALATLYVARNATATDIHADRLCTFASPLVGDVGFANAFNELDVESWRIVNEADLVPKVPFPAFGFVHVKGLQAYNPTDVNNNVPCNHEMHTYLHLIEPEKFSLDWDCDATIPHGPDWS